MSGGGSLHKKDWLKIAGGLALGGTGLGLAGIGPMAGLLGAGSAAGAGEGLSAGLLGTLGSMGPEQAGILAAQNAGLGLGADAATLSAANTAGGGATLGAKLGLGLNKLSSVSKAFQTAQAANGLLSPQKSAPMDMGGPPQQQQTAQIGTHADVPPTTPFSKFDPQWIDYLKRHPELGASYG